ncbi:DUF3592 domain-containing protein [Nonomuraea angiospora]
MRLPRASWGRSGTLVPCVTDGSSRQQPTSHEQGESVPVAYDPADPSDARMASFWSAFLAPLIAGGLGVVFTPIGAVLLVKGRRIARLRA